MTGPWKAATTNQDVQTNKIHHFALSCQRGGRNTRGVKCCFKQTAWRRAAAELGAISVVIKRTVMGHDRGSSALAPGRRTRGSHRHYRPTDRTIMPLMEGNSGCGWKRQKMVSVLCLQIKQVRERGHVQKHTFTFIMETSSLWGFVSSSCIKWNVVRITHQIEFCLKKLFLFIEVLASGCSPSSTVHLCVWIHFPFFFLLLIIIIHMATLKVTDICMQPRKVEREGSREGNETKMVSERMTEMHSPLHKLITVNVSPATHFCHSFLIYFISCHTFVCPDDFLTKWNASFFSIRPHD